MQMEKEHGIGLLLTFLINFVYGIDHQHGKINPACKHLGQFLPDRYDACRYQVCSYGEPWKDEYGNLRLISMNLQCPPGTAVPYTYKGGFKTPCTSFSANCHANRKRVFVVYKRQTTSNDYGTGGFSRSRHSGNRGYSVGIVHGNAKPTSNRYRKKSDTVGYGGSYGNSGTYIGQFYKGNDNGYHLKLKMYDKPIAALLRSTQSSPHMTGAASQGVNPTYTGRRYMKPNDDHKVNTGYGRLLRYHDYPRVVYSDYGFENSIRQVQTRLPDRLPADNTPVYGGSGFGYSAAFLTSDDYIGNENSFTTRTPTIIVKIQSQKNNYASSGGDVYGDRLVL